MVSLCEIDERCCITYKTYYSSRLVLNIIITISLSWFVLIAYNMQTTLKDIFRKRTVSFVGFVINFT